MLNGTKILRYQLKIAFKSDCLVRSKHLQEGFKLQQVGKTSKSCFHKPQSQAYPATKQLPLPLNIEDLAYSEKLKFSPQRNRDINSSYISSSTSSFTDVKPDSRLPVDDRTECYDCSGAINLSSAMQTNVPFPFLSRGKPVHLNMPGGQWGQKEKYTSEDLHNVHHTNIRDLNLRNGTSCSLGNKTGTKNFYFCISSGELNFFSSPCFFMSKINLHQFRTFCSVTDKVGKNFDRETTKAETTELSKKEKLKIALKAYGPVVFVIYIGISLFSLGCCYFLISRGVDLSIIAKTFGVDEGASTAGTAAGIVVAYVVHKALAPVRIALTLSVAPFIVKKLRKKGILKTPPKNSQ